MRCYSVEFDLYTTCYDYQYCCDDGSCCDSYAPDIWGLWYFWLIVIFVISIISSCVGCCVRAARRRRVDNYYRIRQTGQPGYGTQVVVTPAAPPAYGYQQSAAATPASPPPYEVKVEAPPKYQ